MNELNNKKNVIDNQTENDKKDDNTKKHSKGNTKQYGKYTVQSTFAGNSSITEIMNCYIECKASLKYY